MTTDDRIVYRRLQKIRDHLGVLREAAETPLEKFTSNALLYYATERALQISIQAVMDICAYLVKKAQVHMPEEYRDLPILAARLGVFSDEFARKLTAMVGMRNVLVHMYLDVDLVRLHRMLREDLSDFDEFARCVVAYLEKEGTA